VTISERVQRGADWLDENEPDWVARIDLGRLLLHSPCRCICGQPYGDYSPHDDVATGAVIAFAIALCPEPGCYPCTRGAARAER
jgi:hypothetical protein